MAEALDRLREHVFETRDPKAAKPHVRAGTFVKVGVRGERFWCRVSRVRADGVFVGVVDSDLRQSPWRRGDELVFQRSHVLETADVSDQLNFVTLWSALGSADGAALAWRRSREAAGTGVKPHANTRFVLPSGSLPT